MKNTSKKDFSYWSSADGALLIGAWARNNFSERDIAAKIGISAATLKNWRSKSASIDAAIRRNKEIVDTEVENALLRRALGYTSTECKVVEKPAGKEKTVTTKEVAPDIGAISAWLRNRRPDTWTDKPSQEQEETLKRLDEVLAEIQGVI